MAFHPAIEEPSNIWPSENVSSLMMPMSKVTCCHLPRGSVKRKSANLTSLSLMSFRTSLAVVIDAIPLVFRRFPLPTLPRKRGRVGRGKAAPVWLDRIQPGFAGSDANGFLYLGDENLAIANAAGLRGASYGIDRLVDHVIAEHDLDLHLRQKIDDVFRAAIEFRVSLLTPEPLGFRDRNALKSYFLQSLLYFIEFEGLDDRLDFFHAIHPWPARNTRYFRGPLSIAGPRHLLAGSVPTS